MNGIPATIHLDGTTFRLLERRAKNEGTTMRAMLEKAGGILAGTVIKPAEITRNGKKHRTIDDTVIDEWVTAARAGVSNTVIAQRYGVSNALVSLRLRERGIYRQRARSAR